MAARTGWALAASLLLSSCAPVRMDIPEPLASKAPALPVVVKKSGGIFNIRQLAFGGFVATDFDLGWSHGTGTTVDNHVSSDNRQRFAFALQAQADAGWQPPLAAAFAALIVYRNTHTGNEEQGTPH